MTANRARKPLAKLSSNLLLLAKKGKKAAHNIEPTTQPSETFVLIDHPTLKRQAEARVPQDVELASITFFSLFRDDFIINRIVQATNAYARAKHARKWGPLIVASLTSFISITIIFGNTRLPSRRSYWLYRRGNGILGSPATPSIDTRRSSATYTFPTSAGCPATSGAVAKARAFRRRSQELYYPGTHICHYSPAPSAGGSLSSH